MDKPEWRISGEPVPYPDSLALMEARVADIRAGRDRELVWLLEHPPLYTAGTSARAEDLLQPMRFPVHVAGRGGQGDDRVSGGGGGDLIIGGPGRDELLGGPGNDVIRADDGARDQVNCGGGNADRATVDPGDTVVWCEKITVVL